MRLIRALLACPLALTVHGQRLSVGIVGGTNLTNHFPATDVTMPADAFGNPANRFQYLSGPRSFILGASLEGHLTERFSVEANVLHRPLNSRVVYTEFYPDGRTIVSSTALKAVRVWEFPVLLKYSLPSVGSDGRLKPFLAGGPSFRTQEDATAVEPSQIGVILGAGATIDLGRFRITPTLRYTRWAQESIYPRYATKPDQVEFLTSFAYETDAETRTAWGRRIELGAVFGLPLTRAFEIPRICCEVNEKFRYLAGITTEVGLTRNVSLEIDAIYNPLRAGGPDESPFSVLTWQFPILAKYRPDTPGWTPFVEAGPSLRLAGNLNAYDPSSAGITAGTGIDKLARGLRTSFALRYTRWAKDQQRFSYLSGTNPNQVELVFGISF